MSFSKVFKIVANVSTWLLVAGILLIAISILSTNYKLNLPYRLFVVISGSMEPNIPLGSAIVVKEVSEYSVTDVVTFLTSDNAKIPTTHRIVELVSDEEVTRFKTKGDANEDPDSDLLRQENIIGEVKLHIPYLGYPMAFAKSQMGFIMFIVIPATIIIKSEADTIVREVKKIVKKKKKTEEPEKKISYDLTYKDVKKK